MSDATATAASVTPLRHLPGHWYWAELRTTDVSGAAAFYGQLLGWETAEAATGEGSHRIGSIDGREKGAITDRRPHTDVPPHWFAYLTVEDLDASLRAVQAAGGTVLEPAADHLGVARVATVEDPAGARFGLWQDTAAGRTTVKDEEGSILWYELHTRDIDAARAFYEAFAGYTYEANPMGPAMTYYVVTAPQREQPLQDGASGMMQMMPRELDAGTRSLWNVIFNVEDVDATMARVEGLGGTVAMEPHTLEGVGRMAAGFDPQGAPFQVMTPMPRG